MILIDAVYVNNGGGKVLLDYLIEKLEETNKNIFYLLDLRVSGNLPKIKKSNPVQFIKASLYQRNKFYQQHKNNFSSVLCFGNLPPSIKMNAKVFTYFHQPMYLKVPDNFSVTEKIKFWLKTRVLNYFKKNTNFWLVQSDLIKQKLTEKYSLPPEDVVICPFYPPFEVEENATKIKDSYLYVSNPTPHKNHMRLIESFCCFYDTHTRGQLILTVDDSNKEVSDFIQTKQKEGYSIKSVGFISRNKLVEVYKESEFLIFPSLSESFGLGLVEAIDCGCKILGADLLYTYEVCEPSAVFNPYDKNAIVQCLSVSLNTNLPMSQSKISNQIHKIVELLQ